MTSLNRYRDFIDTSTKEGIVLYDNAITNFTSPLEAGNGIKLVPKDGPRLIETLNKLANTFGYDYMMKNVPTRRVVTTTAADTPGDPDVVTISYADRINLLENYSADNVTHCKKNASLIWGDKTFTVQNLKTLRALTNADGEITAHDPPRLQAPGKLLMRERMQSKIMAHQAMEILDSSAKTSIRLQKSHYTWSSADGRDVEADGPTVVALIMSRVNPHYKIDMFEEIKQLKQITLSSCSNDVTAFLDKIKAKKLLIDQKDATAYTEDAFVRDLFGQFKSAPVEEFSLKYKRLETLWLVGKETIVPESFMDEAEALFINLKGNGHWTSSYNPKDQIIALTTEVKSLKETISKLQTKPSTSDTGLKSTDLDPNWRITKVENGLEHNMVVVDGKSYWWCPDGHKWNGEERAMYVTHKPGHQHQRWLERKNRWLENRKRDREATTAPADKSESSTTKDKGDKKLSLSQSLQAALMTKAGLSENQFQQIWCEACTESGN